MEKKDDIEAVVDHRTYKDLEEMENQGSAHPQDCNSNNRGHINGQTDESTSCKQRTITFFKDGELLKLIDSGYRKLTCRDTSTSNEVNSDGKRVCLLLVLFMISIIIVVVFARLMSSNTQGFVTISHQRSTIMFFCGLAVLGTIFLNIHCPTNNDTQFSIHTNVNFLHQCENAIQFVLLLLFWIGGIVVPDAWQIDFYRKCRTLQKVDLIIVIAYRSLKIGFTFLQMIVLYRYKNHRCKTFVSRFTVLLMIPANIGIWLSLLVDESVEQFDHKKHNHGKNITVHFAANASSFNVDDICIKGDTASDLDSYSGIYYPFAMEFCLLTIGTLCEIWGLNYGNGNSAHQANNNSSSKCCETLTGIWKQKKINKCSACLSIIPFVLSVICIGFLLRILGKRFDIFGEHVLTAYSILYLIIHVIMLIASLVAWIYVWKKKSQKIVFGPKEVLLIGSMCALGFWTLFELIALHEGKQYEHKFLFAADILILLSVYFQSSLLLKTDYPPDERFVLRACFLVLLFVDLFMWIEDSFFTHLLEEKVYIYMNEIYDSRFWIVIKQMILPPSIFYRIQAFEMCLIRWISLWQNSAIQEIDPLLTSKLNQ